MPDPTGAAPASPPLQETRIAIAFSGGVSLAVYESGVAVEFFRLVKGEGVYADVQRMLGGPVAVDIMTGTSAGGINSGFLANALVNRGDIHQLLTIWRDEGDLEKLLHKVTDTSQQSLLDGERFRRKICEALLKKRTGPIDESSLQDELDLFITATNLEGDRVVVRSLDGDEIPTRTHRQVFRFRYSRPNRTVPDAEATNDFDTDDDLVRLGNAMRTSAAFPMAFEPMLIERDKYGGIAQHLEADGYHIDGGVLDNRPVELAVNAIHERRARRNVNRLLFFVEPDPEQIVPRVIQNAPREFDPLSVALKAVLSLPAYQSLTSALMDIAKQNERVADRRRTLDYFDRLGTVYRSASPTLEGIGYKQLLSTMGEKNRDGGFQYITPPPRQRDTRTKQLKGRDPASVVFRALEDSYIDLRLEHSVAPGLRTGLARLAEEVDHFAALQIEDEQRLIRKGNGSEIAKSNKANRRAADIRGKLKQQLYNVRCQIALAFDFEYQRRMLLYLIHVVNSVYPSPPSGTGFGYGYGGAWGVREHWCKALNNFKETLYRHEGSLRRYASASKEAERVEMERVELEIDRARLQLQKLRTNQRGGNGGEPSDGEAKQRLDEAETVLRETFDAVRARPFVRERENHVKGQEDTLRDEMETNLQKLLSALDSMSAPDGQSSSLQQSIVEGYLKLTDGMRGFYLRDMMIYPLLQTDTAAAGLQQIRFARISPQDADHFMPGLSARDKLAGETLAHFGGFLKESWRSNDVTWGRLDAAEIIIRKLLPDCDPAERKKLIEKAHKQIIDEMNRYDMGITKPTDTGEKVPAAECTREDLVGREGIADVPASDLIQWSVRATHNLTAMVRNTFREAESRLVPKSVVAAFDRGLLILGSVTVPAIKVFRWFLRWPVLKGVLGVFAIGAFAIVLWVSFLEEWWLALLERFGGAG